MRGAAGAAAALAGLAAASSPLAAEPPDASRCVITQVGDLKVRLDHNRALLDGAVNGRPVRALIDTGASDTLIFRERARALGLSLDDVHGLVMAGAGGTSHAQSAYVHEFRIAGAVRRGFSMLVAGEGTVSDFDVLLGQDMLRAFDIEFDLPHGAVRLLKPRGCTDDETAYWSRSYDVAPFQEDRRGDVLLTVQVDGRPVRAMLDSGAQTSVAVLAVAAHAGIKLQPTGISGRGLGATPTPMFTGAVDFGIGGETVRRTRLRFADLFGATVVTETGSILPRSPVGEPEMLLGMDFLRSHRVLVSRERRKLYFTYEGGPVFVTAGAPAPPPAAAPPDPHAAASRTPAGS